MKKQVMIAALFGFLGAATAVAQPRVYEQENTGATFALKQFKAPTELPVIKDLPDAGYDNAFMVRESDAGVTTKIDEDEVGLQMQPSGTNTLRFFKRN